MKVYTLIIMETGTINLVKTFKTKKSVYEWLRAGWFGEEAVESIKDTGVWDDGDYEINLIGNKLIEK